PLTLSPFSPSYSRLSPLGDAAAAVFPPDLPADLPIPAYSCPYPSKRVCVCVFVDSYMCVCVYVCRRLRVCVFVDGYLCVFFDCYTCVCVCVCVVVLVWVCEMSSLLILFFCPSSVPLHLSVRVYYCSFVCLSKCVSV